MQNAARGPLHVQNNMKYFSNSSTEFLPKVYLLRGRAQCGQIGHDGTSDYENLGTHIIIELNFVRQNFRHH